MIALGNDPRASKQVDEIYTRLNTNQITWEQAEAEFRVSGLHSEAQIKFFGASWEKKQALAATNLSIDEQLILLIRFIRQYIAIHMQG